MSASDRSERSDLRDRWTAVLVGTAAVLAGLAIVKFVAVRPIAFLVLALLYAGAAFAAARGSKGASIGLLVLNVLITVIFGAILLDKGFDPDRYQDTSDFFVVVLGLPAAALGVIASVMHLRGMAARHKGSGTGGRNLGATDAASRV
jgi:hypothetical protein